MSHAASEVKPATQTLPPRELASLLLGLAPLAPDADSAERIRRRVLARVAVLAGDDCEWGPLGDGIAYRVLHDDGRTFGWLMRMAAGTRLPKHSHDDGDEECLVLSGSMIAQGERLGAGDYQVALRHSVHDDVWCGEDALIYLRSATAQRALMSGVRARTAAAA